MYTFLVEKENVDIYIATTPRALFDHFITCTGEGQQLEDTKQDKRIMLFIYFIVEETVGL